MIETPGNLTRPKGFQERTDWCSADYLMLESSYRAHCFALLFSLLTHCSKICNIHIPEIVRDGLHSNAAIALCRIWKWIWLGQQTCASINSADNVLLCVDVATTKVCYGFCRCKNICGLPWLLISRCDNVCCSSWFAPNCWRDSWFAPICWREVRSVLDCDLLAWQAVAKSDGATVTTIAVCLLTTSAPCLGLNLLVWFNAHTSHIKTLMSTCNTVFYVLLCVVLWHAEDSSTLNQTGFPELVLVT